MTFDKTSDNGAKAESKQDEGCAKHPTQGRLSMLNTNADLNAIEPSIHISARDASKMQ